MRRLLFCLTLLAGCGDATPNDEWHEYGGSIELRDGTKLARLKMNGPSSGSALTPADAQAVLPALDWPVLEPLRVLTDGLVDGLWCVAGMPSEAEAQVDNAFAAAGWRKVDDAWVREGFEAHVVAGQGKIKTCNEDNQSFVGISLTRKL